MKKYFLLLILIPVFTFAQRGFLPELNPIDSELHIVKDGESFKGYFLYKIPYKELVFHKKGNSFEAGLKLGIEITEQSTKKVLRNFKQHVASVSDFDLTNSS
ncbi:MAG: hypothetical protein MUO34_01060, partial [Ignavibacteriaceae bacterium]|nr:hypothetical protein [Ignavibacteriaceae bacterium]